MTAVSSTLLTLPREQPVGGASTWRGGLAAAGAATAVLAAVAWMVALRRMSGMDMGPGTGLGSVPDFAGLWIPMMAAMMLPGALPAVFRHAAGAARLRSVPAFLVLYIGVWALVGIPVYALYRPHGHVAAGVATMAAGLYELTPVKARFRARCQDTLRSGLQFGLCCVGSTLGLMVVLLALGVMSVVWMTTAAAVMVVQKILPARAPLDVAVALAILGLGALVVAAPTVVPGLTASM